MAKVPATIEAGTPRGITNTLTNFVIESETLTETPIREDVPDQTGAIVDQILYDVRKDLRLTVRSAKATVTGLPTVNAKITYPSTNGTDWTAAPGTNNAQNYTYPNVPTAGFSLRRAWVSQSCGTVYSNIVTISLWPNSSDTIEGAVCIGDVYQENGFNITADQTAEAGVYTFEQHFATGHCDSMVVLVLTVNPHYEIELEDVVEMTAYVNYYPISHHLSGNAGAPCSRYQVGVEPLGFMD